MMKTMIHPFYEYLSDYLLTLPARFDAEGETIYAARLLLSREEWPEAPDMAWLRQNFHPIYSEWTTQ